MDNDEIDVVDPELHLVVNRVTEQLLFAHANMSVDQLIVMYKSISYAIALEFYQAKLIG